MIKKIISLVIVFAILSCLSAVSFADVPADAAYQYLSYLNTGWGTWENDNTNHKINSASYNSYGVSSWNRQISNLLILADNNAQARDASILTELKKLTNNTSTGGGMIYVLNQILNKIGSITSSNTVLGELYKLSSYWHSNGIGSQNVSSMANDIDLIRQILGSSASTGNIASIKSALTTISNNTLPLSMLQTGWGASLSSVPTTYPTGYGSSYFINVLRELDAIRSNIPSGSGSSGGSSMDYSTILNDISTDISFNRQALDNIELYSAHTVRWDENNHTYNVHVGTGDSALATYKFLTNWAPSVDSPLPTDNPFTLGTGFGEDNTSDFWHSIDDSLYYISNNPHVTIDYTEWVRNTSYDVAASRDALHSIVDINSSISNKLSASVSTTNTVHQNSSFRAEDSSAVYYISANIPAGSEITITRAASSSSQNAKYRFVYSVGSISDYVNPPSTSSPLTFVAPYNIIEIEITPLNWRQATDIRYNISYIEQTSYLNSVADIVSDIRNVLASPSDSNIREESTTVINNYNDTFVTGDHGISGSDVANIGSALSSTSDLLDVDFDFSSLPSVISDLSSEGLSFWSEDVHSALNPFVGDNNE